MELQGRYKVLFNRCYCKVACCIFAEARDMSNYEHDA